MLTCKQFLSELSDFLDESLGLDERKKLEDHISACPNCWVLADTTKKTIQVYKCTEPVAIPSDVRSRLMNALERKMASKQK
ncbi:MAG: zf-HC2 domain-containing protein [Bryobacteraceae bacterium]